MSHKELSSVYIRVCGFNCNCLKIYFHRASSEHSQFGDFQQDSPNEVALSLLWQILDFLPYILPRLINPVFLLNSLQPASLPPLCHSTPSHISALCPSVPFPSFHSGNMSCSFLPSQASRRAVSGFAFLLGEPPVAMRRKGGGGTKSRLKCL